MGNHEEMALDAREAFEPDEFFQGKIAKEARLWLSQGGRETVLSYGLDLETCGNEEYVEWPEAIPEAHWDFLDSGEDELVLEAWHFVHAGLLPPGREWDLEMVAMGLEPRRWIREEFLTYPRLVEGRRVVFGHTPTKDDLPLVRPEKIGVDTGAAYGGPLTAALLDEGGEVLGFVQALGRETRRLNARGESSD